MLGYSRSHDAEFWQEQFGAVDGLDQWHFYDHYEHLDDLAFMLDAKSAFVDWPEGMEIIRRVEHIWFVCGWEGTGETQIMWFPPFLFLGPENTFGCYALHVKQHDDGFSFFACPHPLPFCGSKGVNGIRTWHILEMESCRLRQKLFGVGQDFLIEGI